MVNVPLRYLIIIFTRVHNLQRGEVTKWGVDEINNVGLPQEDGSGLRTEDLVEMTDCQGAGYGVNTPEEIGKVKRLHVVVVSLSERPVDSLILTGDLKIKDFFK